MTMTSMVALTHSQRSGIVVAGTVVEGNVVEGSVGMVVSGTEIVVSGMQADAE